MHYKIIYSSDKAPRTFAENMYNFLRTVILMLALPIAAATGASLLSSCDMMGSVDFDPIYYPADQTAPNELKDLFTFGVSPAECKISYAKDAVTGENIYNTLNVAITKSPEGANIAGWMLPLARTLYSHNTGLQTAVFSFGDMDDVQFNNFLATTTLGLMDHDSRSWEQAAAEDGGRDKITYKADTVAYAPLKSSENILRDKYGITVDTDNRTISIDLTRRNIAINNSTVDADNFVRDVKTNEDGSTSFSIKGRSVDAEGAAYIGVDLTEPYQYDPEALVNYDLSMPVEKDRLLVLTQTDGDTILGQLVYPIPAGQTVNNIPMKSFGVQGINYSDGATGEILPGGGLRMDLPANGAQVTIPDWSAEKFSFDIREDEGKNAYLFVDVKDIPELDFLSSVSIGLSGKNNDTGESVSSWTDPANARYSERVEYLGEVGGNHRYKILLSAFSGAPRVSISVNSISFKNVADNGAVACDIAAVSLHISDTTPPHNIAMPEFVNTSIPFNGIGVSILQGTEDITDCELGAFTIDYSNGATREIRIKDTIYAMGSAIMGISWATYGDSVNYTITAQDGEFIRKN